MPRSHPCAPVLLLLAACVAAAAARPGPGPSPAAAAAQPASADAAMAEAVSAAAAAQQQGGPASKAALIIVDMQNCFLKGGALATCCNSKATLVRRINQLVKARAWDAVVTTQDWHPPGHISFASTHGQAPFTTLNLTYAANGTLLPAGDPEQQAGGSIPITQMLWPDHCVQNTSGAALADGLELGGQNVIQVLKGTDPHMDAYSAFRNNDRVHTTGLAAQLQALNITHVWVAGLALDYCVGWTAIDAVLAGFTATVVLPATAPVTRTGGAEAAGWLARGGVRTVGAMAPALRQARRAALG